LKNFLLEQEKEHEVYDEMLAWTADEIHRYSTDDRGSYANQNSR